MGPWADTSHICGPCRAQGLVLVSRKVASALKCTVSTSGHPCGHMVRASPARSQCQSMCQQAPLAQPHHPRTTQQDHRPTHTALHPVQPHSRAQARSWHISEHAAVSSMWFFQPTPPEQVGRPLAWPLGVFRGDLQLSEWWSLACRCLQPVSPLAIHSKSWVINALFLPHAFVIADT